MTRHSKNSTAGAFFTSAERGKLNYGTKRARLGRDSLRPSTSCHICLQTAFPHRGPVICPQGHLFCRECIITDLLEQRQRAQAAHHNKRQRTKEMERRREIEEMARQHQEIKEFSALNSGRATFKKENAKTDGDSKSQSNIATPETKVSSSSSLPFWLPSKAPTISNNPSLPSNPDNRTYCPTSTHHNLDRKSLITVNWKVESKDSVIVCGGGCGRELSSSQTLLVSGSGNTGLRLSRACGHVICHKCIDATAVMDRCLQCGGRWTKNSIHNEADKNRPWIDLVGEGGGFAATSSTALEVCTFTPTLI